jgi:hypothetical protein
MRDATLGQRIDAIKQRLITGDIETDRPWNSRPYSPKPLLSSAGAASDERWATRR